MSPKEFCDKFCFILDARNFSLIEKSFAKLASFQLSMTVKSDGNEIIIKGLKGPLKEPFESKIVPDNKTFTDVDMGRIGGIRKTTAELKVS